MERILVVKTSAIGDVIQTFPVIAYLKNRFPNVAIDWVIEKSIAPLIEAHPDIHKVIIVDTKFWRQSYWKNRQTIAHFLRILRQTTYDLLFDLQGNTKSGLITLSARAREKIGYSWKSVAEKPNFFTTHRHFNIDSHQPVRKCYLSLVQQFFQDNSDFKEEGIVLRLLEEEEQRLKAFSTLGFSHPKIMICFGSKWENKRLSEKTLIEFLTMINQKINPHFFFLFGNDEEKEIAKRLHGIFSQSNLIGEMSLPLLQRCMNLVDCVIAMDSAALHLCGTTQTPSFSVFGPSAGFVYKPLGNQHEIVQGQCPYDEIFVKRCRILRTCKTGACIKEISSKILFEQFYNFWFKVAKSTPFCTI